MCTNECNSSSMCFLKAILDQLTVLWLYMVMHLSCSNCVTVYGRVSVSGLWCSGLTINNSLCVCTQQQIWYFCTFIIVNYQITTNSLHKNYKLIFNHTLICLTAILNSLYKVAIILCSSLQPPFSITVWLGRTLH